MSVAGAGRAGIAVGLCTYKRPAGLARLLEHVAITARELGEPVTILIADNDGQDAAVSALVRTFEAASGLPVVYVVEPRPGISAARNALFQQVDRLGLRFVAMIDDDEWPSPQWLQELLHAQERAGAAVVGGPVLPVFPEAVRQRLSKWARYWSVERQYLHGKPFVFCTCNFLADMQRLEDVARPLFNDAFGLTGGGDTAFFRGLLHSGHSMAWADAALVYEEVPPARASLSWMRKRKYRVGNHAVRWERTDSSDRRVLLKTLGLTARLPIYPLFRREPESPWLGWLLEIEKVRGRYAAHLGLDVVEYARSDAPGEKACR